MPFPLCSKSLTYFQFSCLLVICKWLLIPFSLLKWKCAASIQRSSWCPCWSSSCHVAFPFTNVEWYELIQKALIINNMDQCARSFIVEGVPQEAESLLNLEARGTIGSPESVNGWDLEGARVTFRSQEIQKINSHSLFWVNSLSKNHRH